jgi:hypothetical protein
LAQERLTALLKPPDEVTVQVVPALWPCCTLTLDGLHETAKSGVTVVVGVTVAQLLTRL